jgi:hypothetical protein
MFHHHLGMARWLSKHIAERCVPMRFIERNLHQSGQAYANMYYSLEDLRFLDVIRRPQNQI